MNLVDYGFLAAILLIYFSMGWLKSFKQSKYAWIDFYWVTGFLIVVAFLASTIWPRPPAIALSVLYIIWALRLGSMLYRRIRKKIEDPRYKKLKAHWGESAARNFYFMFIAEGVLVLVLSIPLFRAYSETEVTLNAWNITGIIIFALSIMGESLSDYQLQQFKNQYKGENRVCNVGLWKYSRHPNYFFEILIWASFAVFNLGWNQWEWSVIPFLVMTVLLTKVTGVPHAEKQALETRGELYREYQAKTSVLIPWFPKESEQ